MERDEGEAGLGKQDMPCFFGCRGEAAISVVQSSHRLSPG